MFGFHSELPYELREAYKTGSNLGLLKKKKTLSGLI